MQETPQKETTPFYPRSPYGTSLLSPSFPFFLSLSLSSSPSPLAACAQATCEVRQTLSCLNVSYCSVCFSGPLYKPLGQLSSSLGSGRAPPLFTELLFEDTLYIRTHLFLPPRTVLPWIRTHYMDILFCPSGVQIRRVPLYLTFPCNLFLSPPLLFYPPRGSKTVRLLDSCQLP